MNGTCESWSSLTARAECVSSSRELKRVSRVPHGLVLCSSCAGAEGAPSPSHHIVVCHPEGCPWHQVAQQPIRLAPSKYLSCPLGLCCAFSVTKGLSLLLFMWWEASTCSIYFVSLLCYNMKLYTNPNNTGILVVKGHWINTFHFVESNEESPLMGFYLIGA